MAKKSKRSYPVTLPSVGSDGRYVRRFEDFEEFLNVVENEKCEVHPKQRASRRLESAGGYRNFFQTPNFAAAVELARGGWPEGAAKIIKASATIAEALQGSVKEIQITADVTGLYFDVGDYVEGIPECWRSYEETPTETPTFKIAMNLCVSAGVSADTIFARGAAVTALVQAAELAGRQVEVVATIAVSGALEIIVPVKAAGQPLQMDAMAFMLAHPSMFRRLLFSAMELAPADVRSRSGVPGGYGSPCDSLERGDLYIGKAHYGEGDWNNVAWVKGWVLEQLKLQGVELT